MGTYLDQPADGHAGMTIGIAQFRTARDLRLDRLLLQPFRGKAGLCDQSAGGKAMTAGRKILRWVFALIVVSGITGVVLQQDQLDIRAR